MRRPPPQHHPYHGHRDVQGGAARAAVFGVSDGLVSNVALILGVAGAAVDRELVTLAGVAGLVAGALSMAAGEYVSMRAQTELVERELAVEAESLRSNPDIETVELARIYESRGLDRQTARDVAKGVMSNPDVALEVHAREELGVDPTSLGSPLAAAVSSFLAFAIGAFVPLLPWLFTGGGAAITASIVLGAVSAVGVGVTLAAFTGKSVWWSAGRQLFIAILAAGSTYVVGLGFGIRLA